MIEQVPEDLKIKQDFWEKASTMGPMSMADKAGLQANPAFEKEDFLRP